MSDLTRYYAAACQTDLPCPRHRDEIAARVGTLLGMIDRAVIGEHRTLGGCKGDSGGPAFAVRGGAPLLVGIITAGRCGGATWAAPLAQYHDWIVETAQQLGSRLGP